MRAASPAAQLVVDVQSSIGQLQLAVSERFHAPPDPYLDRAGYFERCWPGSGSESTFDFAWFRNTEVLTFEGDQVAEIEVYFGWNLA